MTQSVDTYEVEIEKMPVACFAASGAIVRYEWSIWKLNAAGGRAYRPTFPEPFRPRGRAFTRGSARRAAKRVIRQSEAYYARENERFTITVERAS